MQLLNQLREDAARLAKEAAPEVLTALEHLQAPGAVLTILISLIGRLEQDIPGLVHPVTDHSTSPLPSPITTETPSDEEAAANATPPPTPQDSREIGSSITQVPAQQPQATQTQQPTMEQLQTQLAKAEATIVALQQSLTPAAAPQPIVNQEVQQ